MKELKTYRDVIQSLLDGYEVECRDMLTDTWQTVYKLTISKDILNDNTCSEFRLKPSKPSINWEHVSPNFKYLVSNVYGSSSLYEREPIARYDDWGSRGGSKISANAFSSLSKGNCDWKDSLVKRPEGI